MKSLPSSPVAHSIANAAHLLGTCRGTVYNWVNAGRLPAKKLGRRTVILDDDLREFAATLPAYTPRAA